MKVLIGLVPLLLATSLSAPDKRPEAPADHLTFVKILTEGRPRAERADAIECVPVTGLAGPDELCVDWRVAIRLPFDAIRRVTLERERLSREMENTRRWLEGLPELPASDTTVAYGTVLMIQFSDEAAAALEAFVRRHPGELLDLRIGEERIDAFAFKAPRLTPILRLNFAQDLTERFRRLFAPLGKRVSVR